MRLICLLLLSLLCLPLRAAPWFPQAVISDGEPLHYAPLPKASKPWRICALLPQGMDRYWWAISWGLSQEAKRQGVKLGIYEAGGYQFSANQISQVANCSNEHADALVIAAITTRNLCPQVDALQQAGVPVIDLANGADCAGVLSHSRGDFADMAKAAMDYILNDSQGRPIRVAWFPGPQDAGWVTDAERGVHEAIIGKSVTLLEGGYGAVDRASQTELVRKLLQSEPNVDYVLGNAEAAAFAGQLLRARAQRYHFKVVSTYATERLLEQVRAGQVLAAPSDAPVLQASIAIDLAIRALEKQAIPKWIRPPVQMLDANSLSGYNMQLLAPPEGQWMIRQDLPP